MYSNFIARNITEALPTLMQAVLGGAVGDSRNGPVQALTHVGVTLTHPHEREILTPDRKANLAAQIAETAWVLAGRDDLDFLSHYLPRAKDFSDDGETWRGAYGPRLRHWRIGTFTPGVDQLQEVLDILRADPTSRRAVAVIYDPALDFVQSKDIPCNNLLTFSIEAGRLELHVTIRSNDLMWGWSGINAFEWSTLQEIMAGMLGVGVGGLHFSINNLHLYEPHWEKARKIARQDSSEATIQHQDLYPRIPFDATGLDDMESLDFLLDQFFEAEQAIRSGFDSNAAYLVESFPEPMFQSWLRVLQWWWTGDHRYLKPIAGTPLEYATHVSLQPPARGQVKVRGAVLDPSGMGTVSLDPPLSDFIKSAIALHDEKHAAYGDSWKKRGELFSIIPNIARKVDRLGTAETSDETQADTSMDLMIYLAKYSAWLQGADTDSTFGANKILLDLDKDMVSERQEMITCSEDEYVERLHRDLKASFDTPQGGGLIQVVEAVKDTTGWENDPRMAVARSMLRQAYRLAIWQDGELRYRAAERDRALQNNRNAQSDDAYRGADVD